MQDNVSREEWWESLSDRQKMGHLFYMSGHLKKNFLDKKMKEAGIYASQHRILAMLMANPGCSQKEIATMMEVSTPTVAVTLKKMEKCGYIERDQDPKDNRYNLIRVTEKGKQVVDEGFEIWKNADFAASEVFTDEEVGLMISMLRRYHAHLKALETKNG